ncbi:undecaprenyldiphospho-muramoylpentapeptide beta-N-acetylglucosaminyltransferase [Paraglaciecola sp. L3A3]|uniref:undecaprenyldiphospho-muramoylpentapeptide beta-N-acetylglucosaminyltransferase n=1 Tax=Paraglaciecola sp. L3A3 TaxID=2686358 RepID=UPI00131A6988|nr:undecaprenyldiphospho-muramoylpentapeptide beta-N-acetylglucosaminyltransferase [Paraglaciecola sp. L3A3]
MTKRILVMAGGTGGHVFPGLAVADQLVKSGWQVHWLGTQGRMEAKIVPKAGYDISFIDVVGVRNNGLLKLLAAPFKIIKSIYQAHKVIKQFKPNIVIGLGGFASGPGGVAAWLNRIPLVIHEQNAVPGLTNKWLSKIASRVFTGFDNTFVNQAAGDESKYVWLGNPVRTEFAQVIAQEKVNVPLNILVVGGSLGAQILNETVPLVIKDLQQQVMVVHQTGAGHLAKVQQTYQVLNIDEQAYQLSEFIDDIPAAYAQADLVICRAGALTVAEVAAAGVPAIFVPLPHAVDDHQTKNAQVLVAAKAAYLLPQRELSVSSLNKILSECIHSPEKLLEMGQQARTLARLDAAQQVAHFCIELSEQAV